MDWLAAENDSYRNSLFATKLIWGVTGLYVNDLYGLYAGRKKHTHTNDNHHPRHHVILTN